MEPAQPSKADLFVGRVIVREGYLASEHVDTALGELRQRLAGGGRQTLIDVLVERGLLDARQVHVLRQRSNPRDLVCEACGASYTVLGVPEGKTLPCKRCGEPLVARFSSASAPSQGAPAEIATIDSGGAIDLPVAGSEAPTLVPAGEGADSRAITRAAQPAPSPMAPGANGGSQPQTRVQAAGPNPISASAPAPRHVDTSQYGHLTETADPMIGKVLAGKYKLQRKLGQGGMGAVYLAIQMGLNRPCAVKILPPSLARNSESLVERFKREAEACAQLDQANVVRIYDVDHDASLDLHYLAMECVQGQSLDEVVKHNTTVPWRQAVDFTRQAALGLASAHAKGIIHRDIKPANLMLTHEKVVKVMDFGLARLQSASNHLSQTGQLLGTPHYMSPEQARAETCDHRTDIYSLGATLYYMLVGATPFTAPAPTLLLLKVLEEEPASPSQHNAKVPPAVSEVVAKAMAKDREDRYATMEAMIADLEALGRGEAVDVHVPRRKPSRISRASGVHAIPSGSAIGARELLAFGLAGMAILLVAAMVFTRSGRPTTPPPGPDQASSSGADASAKLAARQAELREQLKGVIAQAWGDGPVSARLEACTEFMRTSGFDLGPDDRARLQQTIAQLEQRMRGLAKEEAALDQALAAAMNTRQVLSVRRDALTRLVIEYPRFKDHARVVELQSMLQRQLDDEAGVATVRGVAERFEAETEEGLSEDSVQRLDREFGALEARIKRTYDAKHHPRVFQALGELRRKIDEVRAEWKAFNDALAAFQAFEARVRGLVDRGQRAEAKALLESDEGKRQAELFPEPFGELAKALGPAPMDPKQLEHHKALLDRFNRKLDARDFKAAEDALREMREAGVPEHTVEAFKRRLKAAMDGEKPPPDEDGDELPPVRDLDTWLIQMQHWCLRKGDRVKTRALFDTMAKLDPSGLWLKTDDLGDQLTIEEAVICALIEEGLADPAEAHKLFLKLRAHKPLARFIDEWPYIELTTLLFAREGGYSPKHAKRMQQLFGAELGHLLAPDVLIQFQLTPGLTLVRLKAPPRGKGGAMEDRYLACEKVERGRRGELVLKGLLSEHPGRGGGGKDDGDVLIPAHVVAEVIPPRRVVKSQELTRMIDKLNDSDGEVLPPRQVVAAAAGALAAYAQGLGDRKRKFEGDRYPALLRPKIGWENKWTEPLDAYQALFDDWVDNDADTDETDPHHSEARRLILWLVHTRWAGPESEFVKRDFHEIDAFKPRDKQPKDTEKFPITDFAKRLRDRVEAMRPKHKRR